MSLSTRNGRAPNNLDRFLDQIEEDHNAIQPKIAKARAKLEEARNLVVSRDEVLRVMRLCVVHDAEKNYGPFFKTRIESIWQNPYFDETFTRECDPVLDHLAPGQGAALSDALYYFLPDLILAGIKAKVEEIVPRSARGTLADKRKAIAAAESEVAELDRQSSDLLGQYRTLLDDRYALMGSHRRPSEAPLMNDEGIT